MKKLLCMITMASIVACTPKEEAEKLIGKNFPTIENGLFTPEILHQFGALSDPQVSPDGAQVLYGISYTDIVENRSNRELFVINVDGSNNTQITTTPERESNARWYNGGKQIAFLSGGQIWLMNADGTHRKKISDVAAGISEFAFSPDQTKILFISDVPAKKKPVDLYPDLPKASGKIVDDLMYKHWDQWVEDIPHPFVADFNGKQLSKVIDILEGEPYECPTLPMSGIEQLSWSPDGKQITYSCRKLTGVAYTRSTNTDIYLYTLSTRESKNLTLGMMGYDTDPVFSPDGRYIAWISMEREGYEADKQRLFVIDLQTGEKTEMSKKFDYNIGNVSWSRDGQSLYFTSCVNALTSVYQMAFPGGAIRQLTTGRTDFGGVQQAGDLLIGLFRSMFFPNELVSINPNTGVVQQLTFENKHILDQLSESVCEERWIPTTDNKSMHTWVVYPPGFDPAKTYPSILFCLGGPQGTISQSWSTRWNYRLMAAQGYIVILPNRRGTTAFGQEWTEQISGDYCGQNIQDYLSAVDYMKKEPFVDGNRIAAAGASYGGYSVYYLAGVHNKRFKAFVAHAGIFNQTHMYMTTEEIWFPQWDNGGAPWDKNPVALRHYANSPHTLVDKWDTPILVTHGERDYRVPVDQGLAAFNSAKLLGVEAEMLIFPDENHWVLKAQNSILWNRTFFNFLEKHLK